MLPPRSFYCLTEVSARWSVTPFDVIGWSTEKMLALSVALPPVKAGPADTISGVVDVEAPNLLPLFRRDGTPSPTVAIRRVKSKGREFQWITEPLEGIAITAADVLVRRTEVARFEKEFGLFDGQRRPAAAETNPESDEEDRSNLRRAGPGMPCRFDWDQFHGALTRRIHDHGIPKTQVELTREMLNWFESQDADHVPDESTVARKIRTVWRELHRV